jgi:predicted amidohydrolase YtcJ
MKRAFINGTVMTMDDENPLAEAVLTDGGTIVAAGSAEAVRRLSHGAEIVDLQGKTLLPGFIDAHGHFTLQGMGVCVFADARCAPLGKIKTIRGLIDELKAYAAAHPGPEPIVALNFDDTLVEEYRMPDARDLDQVSRDREICVLHSSVHMASVNTAAMERAGITDESYQVPGGTVYFENGRPPGVFEEYAMAPFLRFLNLPGAAEAFERGIGRAADLYLSQGVTTVCEGAGENEAIRMVMRKSESGEFKLRLIMCPLMHGDVPEKTGAKDPDRIIDGPVKMIADGSIQIYTAGLSQPYHTQHPTRRKPAEYAGFLRMTPERLRENIEMIADAGRSFAVHCNGDRAIEAVLDAFEGAGNREKAQQGRNILIHCQTVREDQLDRIRADGLLPSFFPEHIYVYGDRHYGTFLGPGRAERINPAGSALKRGIVFSLHNDAPVTPCRPLSLVGHAVCRRTSGGRVLGAEYALPVYEALKGVTINAAYQYGLENKLGSIAPGKKADFVLLDADPRACPPEAIRGIAVSRAWIDGEPVWEARGA